LDYFISCYENEILSRDISEDEKEKLIRKVNEVWGKGKPEILQKYYIGLN